MPRWPKLTDQERLTQITLVFWGRVAVRGSNDCWEWQRSRNADGYGQVRLLGENVAHRLAWVLTNGAITSNLCVCHKCDNPPCCNPAHLFLGTKADNANDRDNKKRSATGARNGRRLHPESYLGARNSAAKLTEQIVQDARKSYALGGISFKKLGSLYGVSNVAMSMAVRGLTYAHVKDTLCT